MKIEYLSQFNEEGIEEVYKLLNKYSGEVGFVLKPSIREACKNNEVVIIKEEKIIATCKFHKKRDGFITIYEIVTDLEYRNRGLAKELIDFVANKGPIVLKCPVDNESNKFYEKVGFRKLAVLKGKKRDLNLWGFKK